MSSNFTPADKDFFLGTLLRDVSRSFYLTLRILPKPIRHQIGLAYLLARATDTIADTGLVFLPQRVEALNKLRDRISGASDGEIDFTLLAQQQGSASERILLERVEGAIFLLNELPIGDKQLVRGVVETITSGQQLDLERFGRATSSKIIALQSDAELNDYTFRVAGCVGEFWTKMCLAHFPLNSIANKDQLIQNGIRFGKGLQLVNILRDLSADLLKGRCYIPEPALELIGLKPWDLTIPANIEKFRPVYDRYLNFAEEHLQAGWIYTNTLPKTWFRLRLACAWPILIGLRTIAHLRRENPLDGSRRVKASRREVKAIIARSLVSFPFPPLWRALYQRALTPRLR